MNFCPGCGRPATRDAFCPQCGSPLAQATPSPPRIDLGVLVRGNWRAASFTALSALLLAFLSSGVLLWMADPPETNTSERLTLTMVSTTAAFGAGGEARLTASSEGTRLVMDASGNVMPLTITLVALGTAVLVFRRLTRGYPSIGSAVGDVLRTAGIFASLLLIVAIAFRGDDPEHRVARAMDFEDADRLSWGASPGVAFVIGFATMTVTLLAACFVRGDWLGERLTRLHDHLGAPLAGFGAFLALLPVVGVIAWASFWQTATGEPGEDSLRGAQLLALWISTLGTAGLAYVHGGAGASAGSRWEIDAELADDAARGSQTERLGYAVDQTDAWGLWLAVPTLALVLLLTTFVVARVARRSARPQLGMLWWPVLMLGCVPLLTRAASARGSFSIEGTGGFGDQHVVYGGSGFFGVSFAASLLLPLLAVPVTLLIGTITRTLTPTQLARAVRTAASRLQEAPEPPPSSERGQH
ncbi:zinc ribbon domain-containing protein [Nocardioides daejeonensis]|uniref:zinc ribbon domain-containing protein n=1 Tax=Nocardioides daejeonensis TaxID=1046556 RepID=UPI000D746DC6|nr:zinc ribbon domain-containing protein [Nocardioides daejeonensis]